MILIWWKALLINMIWHFKLANLILAYLKAYKRKILKLLFKISKLVKRESKKKPTWKGGLLIS